MLAPAAHLVVLEKCVAVVFLQARLAVAHRTVGTVRLSLHAAPPQKNGLNLITRQLWTLIDRLAGEDKVRDDVTKEEVLRCHLAQSQSR